MDDYRALFLIFMISIGVLAIVAITYLVFFKGNLEFQIMDGLGNLFK